MDDEVVRIAKKMDKMVQKKNAVSAAGGGRRGRAGGRSGPAGPRGSPGPPRPAPSPHTAERTPAPASWEGRPG